MPFKDPDKRRKYGREQARSRRRVLRLEVELDRVKSIQQRPSIPLVDCIWAAGLFEGEGTATIVRSGTHNRGLISVTSTDSQIIYFFQNRWHGVLRTVHPRKAVHRIAWTWTLNSSFKILCFIADILPHLRTSAEKEKFELLAQAQLERRQGSKSPELRNRLETYRQRMSILNQRGCPPEA